MQLHSGFTLDDAVSILPRLVDLGVSHLYCSPYLASAPGSTHGYDVVDHSRVDDELGGGAAHTRLVAALAAHGLGHVLDIVPNHMAVGGPENRAWWELLRDGPGSRYAGWFDVDWDRHGGRVLLPLLGDPLDQVLQRGELKVVSQDDGPVLRYYDHVFPLAAGTAAGATADRDLLHRQHYLLAHWRDTPAQLNYRRFFDVTTLAGIRVEDATVFDATHRRVLDWAASGALHGIRVDHPDGLADPAAYLSRLAAKAPNAWVVVEKILEPGEDLPRWPVAGTTGYDALALVQQVFVDRAAEQALTDLYGELTGAETGYEAVVTDAKLQVLREILAPEVDRIVDLLERLTAEQPAFARDRAGLTDTVRALLAAFGVYRTYVTYADGASAADVVRIDDAVAAARRLEPRPDDDVLSTIRSVLVADPATRSPLTEQLLVRWQQTTGPGMAKGVEDTTFYRYHRLVALNEVGGDPGVFGIDVEEFHTACVLAQRDWPTRMTTLSTHDTKRSEDVRARLLVLAELRDRWSELVRRWFDRHEVHGRDGRPDANTAYLLFQTLVGAHPLPADRAVGYLEKASREAKQHTSWTDPDPAYDAALRDFVESVVGDASTQADLADLLRDLDPAAHVVSLGQRLVQLTMPGVPDVYQGCELFDYSLVDPDNRRPVDHARRAALAAQLDRAGDDAARARLALADGAEGLAKLHVVRTALRLRRARPDTFGPAGDYTPLRATGDKAAHCLAFVRGGEVVTVVQRLPVALGGEWGETTLELPAGSWDDVVSGQPHSGGSVRVDELLSRFPVALLVRRSQPADEG